MQEDTVSAPHHTPSPVHGEGETVSAIGLVLGELQGNLSNEAIEDILTQSFGAEILVGEPNSPEFIERLKQLYSPRDWTLHVREAVLIFCGKYGMYPPAAVFLASEERFDEWNETLAKTSKKHPQRTAQLMLQPSYARIIALHRQGHSDREIANFLDCRIDAISYAINSLIREGYLPERDENENGKA